MNYSFQIDRVSQAILEQALSRYNAAEIVNEDLKEIPQKLLENAYSDLNEYLMQSYYPSKNKRITELLDSSKMTVEFITLTIFRFIIINPGIVPYQNVVGRVANKLIMKSKEDAVRTASELIAVLAKRTIFDVLKVEGEWAIKSNYRVNKRTASLLDKLQILPPIMCIPATVKANFGSGYLYQKGSVILGEGNHHNRPIGLHALNIAIQTQLSIEPEALQYEEIAKKPFTSKTQEKEFKRQVLKAKDTYQYVLDNGNKFHFDYKYDKRGRLYSVGYHINIQGTEYKKAMLELANPKLIPLTKSEK